jgi:hypothetical protein
MQLAARFIFCDWLAGARTRCGTSWFNNELLEAGWTRPH